LGHLPEQTLVLVIVLDGRRPTEAEIDHEHEREYEKNSILS